MHTHGTPLLKRQARSRVRDLPQGRANLPNQLDRKQIPHGRRAEAMKQHDGIDLTAECARSVKVIVGLPACGFKQHVRCHTQHDRLAQGVADSIVLENVPHEMPRRSSSVMHYR